MRYLITYIILTLSGVFLNAQESTFSGKVIDKTTKEPVLFGTVAIYKDGVLITGTDTDYDGNFYIKLDPGKYKIEAKYMWFADTEIEIEVIKGEDLKLNIEMEEGGIWIGGCGTGYAPMPLVNLENPFSGQIFSSTNGFLKPEVVSGY